MDLRIKRIILFSSIFIFFAVSFFIIRFSNDSKEELVNVEINSVISEVKFERGISIVVDSIRYYFDIDQSYPEMYHPESYFINLIKKGNTISKKSGNNFYNFRQTETCENIFHLINLINLSEF